MNYVFSMTSRMVTIAVTCAVLLCLLLFLMGVEIGTRLGHPLTGGAVGTAAAIASPGLPATPAVPAVPGAPAAPATISALPSMTLPSAYDVIGARAADLGTDLGVAGGVPALDAGWTSAPALPVTRAPGAVGEIASAGRIVANP